MKALPCAKRKGVCRASQHTVSSHISEPSALSDRCGLAEEGNALLNTLSEGGLASINRHLQGLCPKSHWSITGKLHTAQAMMHMCMGSESLLAVLSYLIEAL